MKVRNFKNKKPKERFYQHVSNILRDVQIGDKVYIKEWQIKDKLHNKFNGPFQVLELRKNSVTPRNLKINQQTKVNFNRMKTSSEN